MRLGKTLTWGFYKKHKSQCYYVPFHRWLYEKNRFELLTFTATLIQNLGRIAYTLCAIFFSASLFAPFTWQFITLFVFLVFVLFVVGDLLPRLWVNHSAKKALATSFPVASFFFYLTIPLSFPFVRTIAWSLRKEKIGSPQDSMEEMKETIVGILQESNIQGKLNQADKKLLESVIRFKDRIVREVMVPRVNLFCLPVTLSVKEAAKLLVQEGYSRTPVFRETIDQMIGVLMFKDILELYMDTEAGLADRSVLNQSIESLVKPVFYTPETKKVSHLLQEFRTRQMHMAIVVDEYGGTEGVVTIEDILEEIVGEIADEYDVDEETLYTSHPAGGSWVVDARMNILDAEDIFNIHIPQEGEYDTIGGYVFYKVGAIPPKGLKIHHEDFDLEILSSTERSVDKVRITSRRREED